MVETNHLDDPVLNHARTDFCTLQEHLSVDKALEVIRLHGIGERVVYFYVVDDQGCLVGVLPTRRLLMGQPDQIVRDLMIRRVITIPRHATLMEACECFVLHKFLAFPIVDEDRKLLGVVDVSVFTGEILNYEERNHVDNTFEMIGFRVGQARDASPWRAFRVRFPWLTATLVSGTLCAILSGAYEATLAASLGLAFFLTMVLGLGESVSIQSMTLAIQSLRSVPPTWGWYRRNLLREAATSLLLGLACGASVAAIAFFWRGERLEALVLGCSVPVSLVGACVVGFTVPTLLHGLRLDPKIAAGPVTLALADLLSLFVYFNTGRYVLGV